MEYLCCGAASKHWPRAFVVEVLNCNSQPDRQRQERVVPVHGLLKGAEVPKGALPPAVVLWIVPGTSQ